MKEITLIQVGNVVDDTNIGFKNPQRGRVFSVEGLCPCLNCMGGGGLEPKILVGDRIRKMTERELFRVMGVVDNDITKIQQYENKISPSQQHKMAGNSIVVDCMSEIFRKLFTNNYSEQQQMELF